MKESYKVYIFDFDDSFTYNIYSELTLLNLGLELEVLHYSKFAQVVRQFIHSKEKVLLLLGPGPGHPQEYTEALELLPYVMSSKNFSLFGVCLGHQLMAESIGFQVRRSQYPKHGQTERLILNADFQKIFSFSELSVQRYNSLAVKFTEQTEALLGKDFHICLNEQDEVAIMAKSQVLGFQFHPESVGTSFRRRLFRDALRFLL